MNSKRYAAIFIIIFLLFFSLLQAKELVKIGLLVPTSNSNDKLAMAAIHGAELALHAANSKSGGTYTFELVVRYCDGLWGAASKESVSLVYDDKVCAILGSLDGRNAHLAEQVAAKSHLVFLSTRASDPTLSQAYVPWYFRVVPNDDQQAIILLDEIMKSQSSKSISLIVEDSYDAKYALKAFTKQLKRKNVAHSEPYIIGPSVYGIQRFIVENKIEPEEAVVLFVNPNFGLEVLKSFRKNGSKNKIYGQFSLLGEGDLLDQAIEVLEGVDLVSSQHWFTEEGKAFQMKFNARYNYSPGSLAAYSFDGMNLLIQAIRKDGANPENIKKAISYISSHGATGDIVFDEKGNRKTPFKIIEISGGKINQAN